MDQFYTDGAKATAVAYAISKATGRRVWRHQINNKTGPLLWLVSFEIDPVIALQKVAA